MDEVKKWAITVSAVSIISGVLSSLLSENTYKNLFRFIAGIVLVYAVLQPLIGRNSIDFNIKDYLKENYEVSENIDKYAQSAMLDSAEKAIEDMFSDYAKSKGIDLKIDCSCKLYNNNITVDEIKVTKCVPKENMNMIKQFATESGFDKSVLFFTGD